MIGSCFNNGVIVGVAVASLAIALWVTIADIIKLRNKIRDLRIKLGEIGD